MTDALLSTSSLQIKHDGAPFDRTEKTALVARHAVALANLHVCWKEGAATNCGSCSKCLRTMATLHMLGGLAKANPFPVAFRADALATLYIENDNEEEFFKEVRTLASARGDEAVGSAIDCALRRSHRWRPMLNMAERFHNVPLLWRLAPAMQNWCAGVRMKV